MPKNRDKDLMYLNIAMSISKLGTCARGKVGALLMRNGKPVSFGYNGSPTGLSHCDDVGCDTEFIRGREHCVRSLHAESNAIDNANIDVFGSVLYCTHQPCYDCLKRLYNVGIRTLVYFKGTYSDDHRQKEMLKLFDLIEYSHKGKRVSYVKGRKVLHKKLSPPSKIISPSELYNKQGILPA